ncbi:MAG: hypothetical protein H7A24_17150 [Leptospiraceae bacterium]|nr:hypothetical protein [Leptospiraceae bacterium]MCP5513619.1 hypothetical protein [Leptospiraceae bacterium]
MKNVDNLFWIENEFKNCNFQDKSLLDRLKQFVKSFLKDISGSIPFVCSDWATT